MRKTRDGVPPMLSGEVVSDARADIGADRPARSADEHDPRRLAQVGQNDGRQHWQARWPWCSTTTCARPRWCRAKSRVAAPASRAASQIEDTQDLANQLKAGKLPAPTRIVEEAVVGPSLGKEAINQGLYSSLAGLVIIMIFMGLPTTAAPGWWPMWRCSSTCS